VSFSPGSSTSVKVGGVWRRGGCIYVVRRNRSDRRGTVEVASVPG